MFERVVDFLCVRLVNLDSKRAQRSNLLFRLFGEIVNEMRIFLLLLDLHTLEVLENKLYLGNCSPSLPRTTMLSRFSTSGIKAGVMRTRFFSSANTKTYALKYAYVANMLDKRVPVRPAHLQFTKSFIDEKVLIAGGALLPEMEEGLLLFKGTRAQVEDFAKNDPYVTEGLITKYTIHEWAIAVGGI